MVDILEKIDTSLSRQDLLGFSGKEVLIGCSKDRDTMNGIDDGTIHYHDGFDRLPNIYTKAMRVKFLRVRVERRFLVPERLGPTKVIIH